MRALWLAALLLGLAVGAAEAARVARRRTAEVTFAKPTPECATLSDGDFQSSWLLVDDKCPKAAPFLCATTSDCWKGMESLGYKCAKAAARAAANGTDVDAAVGRIKNLYRSNPTAMINWEKDERPGRFRAAVPVPSPPPSPPSPSPPASPPLPTGNETAPTEIAATANETASTQNASATNETMPVSPATTLTPAGNTTTPSSTAAAEQAAAKKKQEEEAAAKKRQEEEAAAKKKQEEEAAAAAAKKKQEEEAAAVAAQQQAAAQAAAAAAAAKKRSPSPKPKVGQRSPSPAAKTPLVPSATPGSYTRAQVATHNTAANCWYIHGAKIYNVTPYLTTSRHPGGNAVIVRWCGKDATAAFNSAHSTGPAVAQQEAYLVGALVA